MARRSRSRGASATEAVEGARTSLPAVLVAGGRVDGEPEVGADPVLEKPRRSRSSSSPARAARAGVLVEGEAGQRHAHPARTRPGGRWRGGERAASRRRAAGASEASWSRPSSPVAVTQVAEEHLHLGLGEPALAEGGEVLVAQRHAARAGRGRGAACRRSGPAPRGEQAAEGAAPDLLVGGVGGATQQGPAQRRPARAGRRRAPRSQVGDGAARLGPLGAEQLAGGVDGLEARLVALAPRSSSAGTSAPGRGRPRRAGRAAAPRPPCAGGRPGTGRPPRPGSGAAPSLPSQRAGRASSAPRSSTAAVGDVGQVADAERARAPRVGADLEQAVCRRAARPRAATPPAAGPRSPAAPSSGCAGTMPSTGRARCFCWYIVSMRSFQFFSTTSRLKVCLWVSSPCSASRARGRTRKATTRSKGARKRLALATSEEIELAAAPPACLRRSCGSAS